VCAFAARTATALVIADLGTLGGTVSFASAVNACSQVVGCATTVGDGTPLGDVTLLRRSLRPDSDGMKALRVERFNGAKRHLPWWPLQVQIRCAACSGRLGDVAEVNADGH
jgi:uncharacterized membrane protein